MFVQISDENLHRVRNILDDVFGARNFGAVIAYRTRSPLGSADIPKANDFVIWYYRDRDAAAGKIRSLFVEKSQFDDEYFDSLQFENGSRRRLTAAEKNGDIPLPKEAVVYSPQAMLSSGRTESCVFTFELQGRSFDPGGNRSWRTNRNGMNRLAESDRLLALGSSIRVVQNLSDFQFKERSTLWTDTFSAPEKQYVVQTDPVVIERCMLMTTDPGDLVLDPTCGAGTTASVAERWGRRWITIDTSRVALSIARQRLLTARFDHFRTRGGPTMSLGAENPGSGLKYKTAPHITLKSIAQNPNLDPIFLMHKESLDTKLAAANQLVAAVSPQLRAHLKSKLLVKEKAEGKKSITDADRRRWILPPDSRDPRADLTVDAKFAGWYQWEVPFDTDPDWPRPLQDAVLAYRAIWRAKMEEVNACIAANAEQEELVDQPEVVKGVVRVSGPFTVEGVIPEELAFTEDGVVDLAPDAEEDDGADSSAVNRSTYLKEMTDAIRRDGVLFLGNQKRTFSRVEPLFESQALDGIHAEAAWASEEAITVGIAFGPQYGPVTAVQVENLIRASRRYAHLVIAGFSFDPEATAIVEQQSHPKLQIHVAHIRPDMNPGMRGLLKDTPNSQLFTVFGMPAIGVAKAKDGEFQVKLEGVDLYDPVENVVRSTKAEKVAAWFLDSDFDGRCFCICQAFFPDQDAWEKIAKSLGSSADPEAFAAFKGTLSLPFKAGKHACIAVKVIDPRGNEVMTVRKLAE